MTTKKLNDVASQHQTQSIPDSRQQTEPAKRRGKVLPSEKLKAPPLPRSDKRNRRTAPSSMNEGYDASLVWPGVSDNTYIKWNNGENIQQDCSDRERKFQRVTANEARGNQGGDSPQSGEHPDEERAWPQEIHRHFVEAVYETGVNHASPSVIMEQMTLDNGDASGVTSERVKSHLQKYRKNKKKSKEDFMNAYDKWMQKALSLERTTNAPNADVLGGDKKLLGGDLAAFLTYRVLSKEQATGQLGLAATEAASAPNAPQDFLPSAMEYTQYLSGARIPVPVLSEEERNSSLGVSMSHVIGLFYSMTDQVTEERKRAEAAQPAVDTSTSSSINSVDSAAAFAAFPLPSNRNSQPLLHHVNYSTPTGQQQIKGDAPVQEPSYPGKPLAINYGQQQQQ